ncbi:hypothetical protein MBLNU459_g3325t1 [Dothideomycetes sp. NU459]
MFDHVKDTFERIKHNRKGEQEVIGGSARSNDHAGSNPLPDSVDQGSKNELLETTQKAIDVFLYSKQDSGEIGGIGYWQTANGYTAIALHDAWSRTQHNTPVLRDMLSKVGRHHHDYINEFNDDTLWWAQCLLDLSKTVPEHGFLETTYRIWTHVDKSMLRRGQATVRGMDMEGAVMWTTRPGEDQTNAITTGLFSELSARLAAVGAFGRQRAQLLDAAETSFDWVVRCRYRGAPECIVLDTIKLKSQECVDWAFTYTTGQAIAAAAALYTALSGGGGGDQHQHQQQSRKPAATYLALACDMARQAMQRPAWVEADGTLTEHGAYGRGNHDEWKNDDAVGFKSVLLRSLAKLYGVLEAARQEPDLRRSIAAFVQRQYDSLQRRNTNGKGQYGPWWAGPMALPTSHSQLAALDVMAAIHLVQE